jgi:hypothetical protein
VLTQELHDAATRPLDDELVGSDDALRDQRTYDRFNRRHERAHVRVEVVQDADDRRVCMANSKVRENCLRVPRS